MRKTLTSLASWALVIAAVLSLDFVVSWVFHSQIISAFEHEQRLRVRSPIFHHGLAPNLSVAGLSGQDSPPIVTNSLGFRDTEPRDVPLRSANKRLLVIGDAFVEGRGVPYEKSSVGLMTKSLAAQGVEVLNAAAVAYSPAIYYAKIKYLIEQVGLQIDEVMVFLDISDIEDEALAYDLDAEGRVVDSSTLTGGWSNHLSEDLRDSFMTARAYFLIRERLQGAPATKTSTSNLGRRAALWTTDEALFRAFGERGLEKASEHMTLLCELLTKRGIPLTVVVYPWPDQVVRHDLDSRQVSFWRRWTRENGAGFIDLFPTFINESAPADVLARFWLPGDVRWSEAGHEIVAAVLLRAYAARAL